jgi:pyruvate carboxylase
VYKHEIPGGQYSNLKPQAYSLGLADRMDEITQAYMDANQLFGDIVKVTPSSKVVGDLAMFMVNSKLTKKDVLEKGDSISFPDSVKGMMKGELGQPEGGWPADFQKMVLKNEAPLSDLPGSNLAPVDFETECKAISDKLKTELSPEDFLSYKFYPKVFEDYFSNIEKWGNLSALPTPVFFYGLKPNEEVMVSLAEGKTLLVKFLYKTEPDENGNRSVYFKLNGQTRAIEVKDLSIRSANASKPKATSEKEIGVPLPGLVRKIWVKEGEEIKANQPLFTIEAMKMENTVVAQRAGVVGAVNLNEGTLAELNDLIITLS